MSQKGFQVLIGVFLSAVTAALFLTFAADSQLVSGVKLPTIPELEIFNAPGDIKSTRPGADKGDKILGGAMWAITQAIKSLLGVIAIIFIVWSSILMISGGGNEDQLERGKRGVTYGLLGLVFALMIDDIIFDIIYGGRKIDQGTILDSPASADASITAGIKLTLDAIEWFKGVVIIAAVAFIILSGVRMITALGNSEEISTQRNVILWVGIGIVVILLNDIIIREVLYPRVLGNDWEVQYSPDSARGISEAIGLLRYFLGFLAVIAFAALVYGGALMISSFGNEDRIGTAKKVLQGAAIGIVVILTSYVIVSTFVSGTVG
jgi:hypothetical protein